MNKKRARVIAFYLPQLHAYLYKGISRGHLFLVVAADT